MTAPTSDPDFDYDWIIVGSGFGGSVAALRLSEKGYRVAVIECGHRYADDEYARSAWDLRRFVWAPKLGLRGIMRLTTFRDIFIVSGSAVGGGSAVYANTLYRARPAFFSHPQWAGLRDWESTLEPHYATAEHMLGVQVVPFGSDGQELLRELGAHFGVADSFSRTPVGVFFGTPGETVPDPYFGGEGPARTGCLRCGACMVGCRHGAKNTLLKNYLWFAERRGTEVFADRMVTDIRPIGDGDGTDGYRITTQAPGAWFTGSRRTFTARGVVVAAGALGTNRLLLSCKARGSLPRLSPRLGELVRTNSESILAVSLPDDRLEPWRDVAISASIHPRPDTHIEFCTYGESGDAMSLLLAPLTGQGTRGTRPLLLLASILRHPLRFLRGRWPFGWSRRSLVVLVMQTSDNAIAFRIRRRLFGGFGLRTEQDRDKPNPTFIDVANAAAEWLAERTGGIPQSSLFEAAANIPSTAHILGGAPIGGDATSGAVDGELRAFGYRNLIVCDGSAMPANPGVNPSLTIAALAEHAMAQVAAATGSRQAERPDRTTR
ncbi:MAG: GMC family oxidoreductase [Gemmatimonadaceae bacterium]|nr:GMC family oxidoreductase [Gemmatimonadaceae bacterium]